MKTDKHESTEGLRKVKYIDQWKKV